MLLGIKLSNLSREQKNFKAKKKLFNQVCQVLEPRHSVKKTLPSAICTH